MHNKQISQRNQTRFISSLMKLRMPCRISATKSLTLQGFARMRSIRAANLCTLLTRQQRYFIIFYTILETRISGNGGKHEQ